ncbi:hypothetical protein CPB86DRAFT_780208 [Serendipita vermifera]|nr:hypothetical protein CPB86DRAFT_780208 [Serendipita vermifera]
MLRFVNVFLFFAAFLLLLLNSVSLPIAKSIKYFSIYVNFEAGLISSGVRSGVSFGNWGWCTTPTVVETFGFQHTEPGECSKAKLGFDIDDRLVNLLDLQGLEDTINGTLTFALVLNPIACGITFLTLLFAIWFALRQTRFSALLGVLSGVIAAILATIAFVIDITIMAVAKKNIEKISDNFHVTYEQTTWMTLVAMIILWIAVIIFCIIGLRGRRTKQKETY